MKPKEVQFISWPEISKEGVTHVGGVRFLKLMVLVSILLPTFPLPTVNAQVMHTLT